VAVGRDGRILWEDSFGEGMVHGRELVARLRNAFRHLGLSPRDIRLLVADLGPGSFTGMRVGITTAKALAFASGASIVGVRAPDAIARNLAATAGPRCVLVDAKRGQVYAVDFRIERESPVPTGPLRLFTPDEIVASIPPDRRLLGDGLVPAGERLRAAGFHLEDESCWRPRADRCLELGLEEWRANRVLPPEAVAPLYLRPSAPEERRRRKGAPPAGSPRS
jgi:tRNA threonylcarbamoyladenosine biosynthesis protein TsaB